MNGSSIQSTEIRCACQVESRDLRIWGACQEDDGDWRNCCKL